MPRLPPRRCRGGLQGGGVLEDTRGIRAGWRQGRPWKVRVLVLQPCSRAGCHGGFVILFLLVWTGRSDIFALAGTSTSGADVW